MSRTDPGSLVVRTEQSSQVMPPSVAVVTIGRDAAATVRIDDQRVSGMHVRAEIVDGRWQVVDTSENGMYVGGTRAGAVPITRELTLRLGDPTDGPSVWL